MYIYMQTAPDHLEPPHYYQLRLEQDLFGGWTLYREWGRQGGRTSFKREQFLQHAHALAALKKNRDTQLKRGFQIMLTQS